MDSALRAQSPDYSLLLERAGDSFFRPRDDHVGVEISVPKNGQPYCSQATLAGDQIAVWATGAANDESDGIFRFCLLICAPSPPSQHG